MLEPVVQILCIYFQKIWREDRFKFSKLAIDAPNGPQIEHNRILFDVMNDFWFVFDARVLCIAQQQCAFEPDAITAIDEFREIDKLMLSQ